MLLDRFLIDVINKVMVEIIASRVYFELFVKIIVIEDFVQLRSFTF
jgi:hypothetical protein